MKGSLFSPFIIEIIENKYKYRAFKKGFGAVNKNLALIKTENKSNVQESGRYANMKQTSTLIK